MPHFSEELKMVYAVCSFYGVSYPDSLLTYVCLTSVEMLQQLPSLQASAKVEHVV